MGQGPPKWIETAFSKMYSLDRHSIQEGIAEADTDISATSAAVVIVELEGLGVSDKDVSPISLWHLEALTL